MKTVTKQFTLLLLLLCLAVFTVACNQEVPGEQLPQQPDASTTEDTDTTQEIDTPTPEQPPEKELPAVLTAPLSETFADANKKRINEVNRALKDSGISEINAKEFFRTQHADTYIGSLGVSELYLEQDAQGKEHIVRLVFDLGGLAAASVHATTEAPDWLQPRWITPVMIANIREDARMTMLQMLLNAGNTVSPYELRSAWSAHKDQDFYFILGYDYYKLPEEHEATHLVISMYDGKVNDVTLRYPQDEPTPPADFYPTPDVLYSEKNGVYKVFFKLCNVGYDVKNESALRALLRELWADDLLQSNDDYDTYALPDSPEMLVRVARIGKRGTVSTYAIPREHIDTRPVALCTPADIAVLTEDMTNYLQHAVSFGYEGISYHRIGLIGHWLEHYAGSDDLRDYFYVTVPTEQQIAAGEMVDVLVIHHTTIKSEVISEATIEQRSATVKAGIGLLSPAALIEIDRTYFEAYLSMLRRSCGLTRDALQAAWASYYLGSEQATVRDNLYGPLNENCPVYADIYTLHPTGGQNINEIDESELFWIEYYEDGTHRGIGKGTYVPHDKVIE